MTTELVLVNDEHYMNGLKPLSERLAKSSLIPKRFAGKPEEIAVIGYTLADLDIRLTPATLAQMYAVDNTPGFYAQMQIMLANRHGVYIVPLDKESNDKIGKVKVLGRDHEWHEVSVTIEEANQAGWASRNPNYQTQPANMLLNRACTKAVRLHCPEAKLVAALERVDSIPPVPSIGVVDALTVGGPDVP